MALHDRSGMSLGRKVYDKLLQWKEESNGTSALLVEGAHCVGKSFIVEEFAKNEYSSYILNTKDIRKEGNILYLPVYMSICL